MMQPKNPKMITRYLVKLKLFEPNESTKMISLIIGVNESWYDCIDKVIQYMDNQKDDRWDDVDNYDHEFNLAPENGIRTLKLINEHNNIHMFITLIDFEGNDVMFVNDYWEES